MGLDWLAEKKTVDGVEIEPHDTLADNPPPAGSFLCDPDTSFRGKMFVYVGLPKDVVDSAYCNMSPTEALTYADELEVFVDNNHPFDEGQDGRRVVVSAIGFLRFWGSRGHGIFAWY